MPADNKIPDKEQRLSAILRPLKRPPDGPLGCPNRRAAKRYHEAALLCQVLAPKLASDIAEIVDFSTTGACLSLKVRVPLNAVLRLRLSNRQQLCLHEVTFHVLHFRGGDGHCLVGGIFETELSAKVFRALIG